MPKQRQRVMSWQIALASGNVTASFWGTSTVDVPTSDRAVFESVKADSERLMREVGRLAADQSAACTFYRCVPEVID